MHDSALNFHEVFTIEKGGKETAVLKVEQASDKQFGGVRNKSKAEVTNVSPGSEGSHNLKVIVKEVSLAQDQFLLGDEQKTQSEARRYYERWRYLKKIGIPVVSSMRVVDSNRILMGDMTADGSEFVGKETYWSDNKQFLPLSELEKKFLTIDPELIKNKVEEVFLKAWDNGIVLPDDNEEFTVLVHPDGTWKVMVKDLEWLRITTEMKSGYFEEQKTELLDRVDRIRESLRLRKYNKL